MAFSSRGSLLTLFFIIAIGLAGILAASSLIFLFSWGGGEHVNFFESHSFWFTYDITPRGSVSGQIGMILVSVGGFSAFYLFRVLFKKIGQAEVFFFTLFFFSLLAETLRMTVIMAQVLELPPIIGIILTRLVYGGRIFGLLSLFFASLYALDFQYQKFEILVTIMLLFSFFLSFSVPFDSQLLLTDGLYKLNDEQGVFIIYCGLAFFLMVNYLITVTRGRLITILAGIVLLLAGRELLFFALSPLFIVIGALAFFSGFFLTYKSMETHFNWM